MEPITAEKAEALIAKHKRGAPLDEEEVQYLREYKNVEDYRARPGHDFGQLEFNLGAGRLEEIGLRERNALLDSHNPRRGRNDPGPFVQTPGCDFRSSDNLADASMGWFGLVGSAL